MPSSVNNPREKAIVLPFREENIIMAIRRRLKREFSHFARK
jgi:hypothetical protein